jgi:hypothetical protein
MFRPSNESPQVNLFTSGDSLFSGKSLKLYQDPTAWQNQFRNQVTMRVDEGVFESLYSSEKGTPNASIRVLIAMMVLKEAEGMSDEKLFENCRFNMLIRSALGLINADDSVPTESTYYLFRKNINEYAKEGNENLFDTVFASITKKQCLEFNVSGKRIRMDSKLLGSNIAWLSRYELVHETLRLFYRKVKKTGGIGSEIEEELDQLLQFKGNKVVYTSTSDEVKAKLQELGEMIYKVLPLFSTSKSTHYTILKRVFHEQFRINDSKLVITRNKEEISAKSIQSPHDTDCDFRNKDGNKVKGYSFNATESCDDKGLNLIGDVNMKEVTASDVEFLPESVEKAEKVFLDKTENIHADGAYHSPDNQAFCTEKEINLYLHAIQGAKGRYQLDLSGKDELTILDTKTRKFLEVTKITGKNNEQKWRIKTDNGYRYFTQKEIDTSKVRKKIEETPVEVLQKRNNVEATIFQLGYHYPNAKSRYRGLIKHQMWVDMRCLWVNFVRILKFIDKTAQKAFLFEKLLFRHVTDRLILRIINFILKPIDKKNHPLGKYAIFIF